MNYDRTARDLTECRIALAALTGAVSRWCSLTGNVPDATIVDSKQKAELDAFAQYLEFLDRKKQKQKPLQF